MRLITLAPALTAMLFAAQVYAQSAPDMQSMASAADVAALIAKAKRDRKPDQPTFIQPLLKFAPYTASLEYRAAVGPAAVHETEAEMFYVIEGSGTLTLGGSLVNEKRSNAANLSGTAIQGGSSKKVAKGDFFVVPEKMPHWFNTIDGTLVLMSLHVPRPVASGQ